MVATLSPSPPPLSVICRWSLHGGATRAAQIGPTGRAVGGRRSELDVPGGRAHLPQRSLSVGATPCRLQTAGVIADTPPPPLPLISESNRTLGFRARTGTDIQYWGLLVVVPVGRGASAICFHTLLCCKRVGVTYCSCRPEATTHFSQVAACLSPSPILLLLPLLLLLLEPLRPTYLPPTPRRRAFRPARSWRTIPPLLLPPPPGYHLDYLSHWRKDGGSSMKCDESGEVVGKWRDSTLNIVLTSSSVIGPSVIVWRDRTTTTTVGLLIHRGFTGYREESFQLLWTLLIISHGSSAHIYKKWTGFKHLCGSHIGSLNHYHQVTPDRTDLCSWVHTHNIVIVLSKATDTQ